MSQEMDKDAVIAAYKSQLTAEEIIACEVAKECLATSFNIEKSIGFRDWLKKNHMFIYQYHGDKTWRKSDEK